MTGRQFFRSLYHSFFYNTVYRRELSQVSSARFEGLQLMVPPEVHHPVIFRSGRFFAAVISKLDLHDKRVLDMGTGSGILALCAAQGGADVTAVDKDPAAVRCAAENARHNGLGARIRVLGGDLFSTLGDARFHLILFNPPYLLEETGSFRDLALYGGSTLTIMSDFAQAAADHLTPDGSILMVVSTDSNVGRVLQIFRERGYDSFLIETKKTLFETFYVYRFERHSAERKPLH